MANTTRYNCKDTHKIQDTYVLANKQLEIYACKRFISPERARARHHRHHRYHRQHRHRLQLQYLSIQLAKISAKWPQTDCKCVPSARICPRSGTDTLRAIYIWTHTHMSWQPELVVRSTRLSFKSRPSRWPSILANRQPSTNVNTSSHLVLDSLRIHIHIHIRGECVQLINWI